MPRKARPNRTDLLAPSVGPSAGAGQPNGRQPVRVPTGGAYGEAKSLAQSQQAAPLPSQAPTPAPGGAAAPDQRAAALAAARQFQMPPSGGLTAPTQRPGEPVTAGLPMGAGPGPEAIRGPASVGPLVQGAGVLNMLGDNVDASTAGLRAAVNAQVANRAAP